MNEHTENTAHVDVGYVAQLARLRLTKEETSQFQEQLDHILAYVGKLDELDVDGVEPMAHAIDMTNVFRDDEPGPCMEREDLLKNAPRHANEQILVPRILE